MIPLDKLKFPKHFFLIIGTFICYNFIFLVLTINGTINIHYSGFAFDSNNQLYVGKYETIELLQNGFKIKSINPKISNGYTFTIQNDQLIIAANSKVYTTDLDGNVINEENDRFSTKHNQLYSQRKIFKTLDGKVYKSTNWLGYYMIWRVDTDLHQLVFHMPLSDYIVKVLFAVSCILFVTYGIVFIFSNVRWIQASQKQNSLFR